MKKITTEKLTRAETVVTVKKQEAEKVALTFETDELALKQLADAGLAAAQEKMVDLLVNNKKDVESAAPYLKQLIKVHPERLDFKLYMGVHYLYTATAERNEEYGIKLIEEVLAKDPGNWRATETLGLYNILKDLDTGIAWLEKIFKEDKNNTTAAILLGRYYIKIDETKGIAWFEKILAEDKNNVTVIEILGNHYFQKGRANAEGIGMPVNLKQALMWYKKANDKGHPCEEEIKNLERRIQ